MCYNKHRNLMRFGSVDVQRGQRCKRSTGTFAKSIHSRRDTGRSGLVRSALEKLFSIFVLGNKSDTARRVPTRLPNESNDLVLLCSCTKFLCFPNPSEITGGILH